AVFDAVVFFAAVVFFDAAVVVFAAVAFAADLADLLAAAFLVPAVLDVFAVFFAVDFDAAVVLDPPGEAVPAVPSDFSVTVVDCLSTLGSSSPFASVGTSPFIRTALRPKSSGPRTVGGARIVRPYCNDWFNAEFSHVIPAFANRPAVPGRRSDNRVPRLGTSPRPGEAVRIVCPGPPSAIGAGVR